MRDEKRNRDRYKEGDRGTKMKRYTKSHGGTIKREKERESYRGTERRDK